MSQVFHKSCYTSRSSGYKYRTLSTNTGERKKRDSREDNIVDKVFKDLRREISLRIDKELDNTERSRSIIFEKFEKVDSKINAMLELQDNVLAMRQSLNTAENTLLDMLQKVKKIEAFTSDPHSLKSKKSPSIRTHSPVLEEQNEHEILTCEITPV